MCILGRHHAGTRTAHVSTCTAQAGTRVAHATEPRIAHAGTHGNTSYVSRTLHIVHEHRTKHPISTPHIASHITTITTIIAGNKGRIRPRAVGLRHSIPLKPPNTSYTSAPCIHCTSVCLHVSMSVGLNVSPSVYLHVSVSAHLADTRNFSSNRGKRRRGGADTRNLSRACRHGVRSSTTRKVSIRPLPLISRGPSPSKSKQSWRSCMVSTETCTHIGKLGTQTVVSRASVERESRERESRERES